MAHSKPKLISTSVARCPDCFTIDRRSNMIAIADMLRSLHDAMSEASLLQVTNQGTYSTAVQREEIISKKSPFTITYVVHIEPNPNVNTVIVQSLCKNKDAVLIVIVYFKFRFHNLIFLKNSCFKNRIWNSPGRLCLRLGQGLRVKPFAVVYLFSFKCRCLRVQLHDVLYQQLA